MRNFEEDFTAWVDGRLEGDALRQFERELAARPDLAAERENARGLGDLLRQHGAAPELANADFFNHQILERIEREERGAISAPRPAAAWPIRRLIWAGAACFLIAWGIFQFGVSPGMRQQRLAWEEQAGAGYMANVVETHTMDPRISATAFHSRKNDVTVLWLDGLEYIPASYALR